MTRLLPLLLVCGLFVLQEVSCHPYIRIGDRDGFHPFVKWICPKCDPSIKLSNWGGNFQFSTQNINYPRTVEEVQKTVKQAKGRIRVLGTRHSFSTIADSTDTIISTLHLNAILGLDPTVPSVTVEAGITYTDLAPFLESVGFGLNNLASLAEISIGGASQTGAHGSGLSIKNLANQIRSLKIVLANGTLATYGPNDPELKAIALGLGVFGVIVQIELKIQPSYKLRTRAFVNMPQEDVFNHFDEIENKGYTVQFFTDFSNLTHWTQVWVNVKTDQDTVGDPPNLFGAPKAPGQVSPIAALPSTYTMEQGKEQPWYYGLVDYRLGLSGFDGAEIQTEWLLPYQNAVPAIKAVSKFGAEIAPYIYTMLIRTIEADDLWMSAEYQQRSVAIHFTWKPNMTAVLEKLPKIENAIKPFKARPHWGKVYTMKPSDYLKYYPKLKDFKKLADKLDPQKKFRNAFIDKNVFVDVDPGSSSSSSSEEHDNPWDWLTDLINKLKSS